MTRQKAISSVRKEKSTVKRKTLDRQQPRSPPKMSGSSPAGFIPTTAEVYDQQVLPIVIASHVSNALLGINLAQFYYVGRLLWARKQRDRFVWSVLTFLLICGLCDSILKMLPSVQIVNALSGVETGSLITKSALVVAACLSVLQIPFAVLVTIRLSTKFPYEWFPELTPILSVYLASAAGADVILCGAFIFNLKAYKADFARTNSYIDRWIRLALECMIIPTLLQIARWVLVQTMPEKSFHYTLTFVITKTYTMATLVLYAYLLNSSPPSSPGPVTSAFKQRIAMMDPAVTSDGVIRITDVVTSVDEPDTLPIHLQSFPLLIHEKEFRS
ncbi:hypothetical protein BT69DRAFT_1348345 [Atractiella rhizophila]|nr:hypothetical protein BT69DRAFT_1348345 [Atractiella rhizophila]